MHAHYRSASWALSSIDDLDVAVNVVTLERALLPPGTAQLIEQATGRTLSEWKTLATDLGCDDRVVTTLQQKGIISDVAVADDASLQLSRMAALAENGRPNLASTAYGELRALRGTTVARTDEPLEILIVGGCVGQFATTSVRDRFAEAGHAVQVTTRWPGSSVEDLAQSIADSTADVIVVIPWVATLLHGVWDARTDTPEAAQRARSRALARIARGMLKTAATAAGDRLVLFHNLAAPGLSAHGRFDPVRPVRLIDTAAEVNRQIAEQAKELPNVMVVDEEGLARQWGTRNLFDDHIFPFSHHGGAPDPSIEVPHQTPLLSDLLAEEYLSCFVAHRGTRRIKCLAVDLDNTLWPGVLADHQSSWSEADTTSAWMHRGLHQALQIVQQRGVLLASVSKGDRDVTLRAWRDGHHPGLLHPDDFVEHYIGWGTKSRSIATLCDELGVAPEAVAVLDDFHVERAEIRKFGPPVEIVDLPVPQFRTWLLEEPRLQTRQATSEARQRTETTKASLHAARLADSIDDYGSLIAELDVSATIRPANGEDAERIAELVNRTTQFTLGHPPMHREALAAAMAADEVRVLEVQDSMANYGLVGACVVSDGHLRALAVSCRVVALDVGPLFVSGALQTMNCDRVSAQYVFTGRNGPAAEVLHKSGFQQDPQTGEWSASLSERVGVGSWPHHVTLVEGAGDEHPMGS